jgi:hypothetical protein
MQKIVVKLFLVKLEHFGIPLFKKAGEWKSWKYPAKMKIGDQPISFLSLFEN